MSGATEIGIRTSEVGVLRAAAAFWRIVWKEYRTMRGFWIAMAVLGTLGEFAVSRVLPPRLVVSANGTPPGVAGAPRLTVDVVSIFSVALVFAALYCTASGATMFAGEKELGTHEFLRGLPISSRKLLGGKLGFALASTLLMAGLLLAVAIAVTNGEIPDETTQLQLWALWGLAALEGLAWGMLFSLLIQRPLLAAILAVAAASACINATVWSVYPHAPHFSDLSQYSASALYRLGVVAIVLLIDLFTVNRLFGERGRRANALLPRFLSRTTRDVAVVGREPAKPSRSAILGRLVWQTWRQSRWLMISLAVIGALAALTPVSEVLRALPLFDRNGPKGMRQILFIAVIASLMGSSVFLADREGNRVLRLIEQGVRPRSVWLARELTWIAAFAIWACAVHAAWFYLDGGQEFLLAGRYVTLVPDAMFAREFDGAYRNLPPIAVSLRLATTSFACGQLASMLFKSGIVSTVIGCFVSLIAGVWVLLMNYLDVNWVWSVAPIPFCLFLATWLRAPEWALGRNSWRGWTTLGATVLVPAAVLLFAVPYYRIHEIPLPTPLPPPDEIAQSLSPTAEQRTTAELFLRAGGLLKGQLDFITPDGELPLSEKELAFLNENHEALEMALEASRRPVGTFYGQRQTDEFWPRIGGLWSLLRVSASKLQMDGNLDEAWEHHLALLRLNLCFRSFDRTTVAYDQFPAWAAYRGQTRDRILTAIKTLKSLEPTFPRPAEAIKADYLVERRWLLHERTPESIAQRDYKADDFLISRLAAMFPGERERGLRLLEAVSVRDLDAASRLSYALESGDPVSEVLAEPRSILWPAKYQTYRELEESRRMTRTTIYSSPWETQDQGIIQLWRSVADETRRRATIIVMAVEAWKVDHHGSLPEKLEDLIGIYLDVLPLDPYTGRSFLFAHEGLTQSPPLTRAGQYWPLRPFIWSAGERVLLPKPPDVNDKQQSRPLLAIASCLVADKSGVASPRTWHIPVSDDEIWLSGQWFEIPSTEPEKPRPQRRIY